MELRQQVIVCLLVAVSHSAPLGFDPRMPEVWRSARFGYEPTMPEVWRSARFGYEPTLAEVWRSARFGYEPKMHEVYYKGRFDVYPNFHDAQQMNRVHVWPTPSNSKGLFTNMGSFIGSMFPIEINVPDLFAGFWASLPRPFANRWPQTAPRDPIF